MNILVYFEERNETIRKPSFEAIAAAKSLGATVMKDVTEVMGMGWLSIIVDPTGAMLGLWKAKAK